MRLTGTTFAEKLKLVGLTQTEYRDLIFRMTNIRRNPATTHNWFSGSAKPPPEAIAILEFVARLTPLELQEFLKDFPEE